MHILYFFNLLAIIDYWTFALQFNFSINVFFCNHLPGSQKIFKGRPNISAGQLILVQPKYNPT